jgi:GNAT superfamily N-acetyltransferase
MLMHIRQATLNELELIATLFDAYRQFYGQPTDIDAAMLFLSERFLKDQSVIFLATHTNGNAVGFTQLFPSFSSVSMARTFILNDLYVVPEARRGGVGSQLLAAAALYARMAGAIRLTLSTAIDNSDAKALYVSQGWKQDEAFDVFHLAL